MLKMQKLKKQVISKHAQNTSLVCAQIKDFPLPYKVKSEWTKYSWTPLKYAQMENAPMKTAQIKDLVYSEACFASFVHHLSVLLAILTSI